MAGQSTMSQQFKMHRQSYWLIRSPQTCLVPKNTAQTIANNFASCFSQSASIQLLCLISSVPRGATRPFTQASLSVWETLRVPTQSLLSSSCAKLRLEPVEWSQCRVYWVYCRDTVELVDEGNTTKRQCNLCQYLSHADAAYSLRCAGILSIWKRLELSKEAVARLPHSHFLQKGHAKCTREYSTISTSTIQKEDTAKRTVQFKAG